MVVESSGADRRGKPSGIFIFDSLPYVLGERYIGNGVLRLDCIQESQGRTCHKTDFAGEHFNNNCGRIISGSILVSPLVADDPSPSDLA